MRSPATQIPSGATRSTSARTASRAGRFEWTSDRTARRIKRPNGLGLFQVFNLRSKLTLSKVNRQDFVAVGRTARGPVDRPRLARGTRRLTHFAAWTPLRVNPQCGARMHSFKPLGPSGPSIRTHEGSDSR